MAMRIAHITHSYWPATAFGGPIVSTLGLCNALAQTEGIELRVSSTDAADPHTSARLSLSENPAVFPAGYKVQYSPQFARNFAPWQLLEIYRHVCWSDGVLLTGTYSFHVVPTLLLCRFMRKKVAWSPRGALLDSYRWSGHRKPRLKRIFELVCRLCAGSQTFFIVTSEDEAEAVERLVPGVKVRFVGNGIEVPIENPKRKWRPNGLLRLVYLGRLDPKKGLENLFKALAQLPEFVTLDVYGAGKREYELELVRLAARLDLKKRIVFHGHVDDEAKVAAFENADLFVLPTFSENFGIVVGEALATGLPVISSTGAPWQGLEIHGAGVWTSNEPSMLAEAIRRLLYADLEEMGQKGRRWIMSDFSWQSKANSLVEHFQTIS